MRSAHRLKGVGEKGNYLNPENGDMTTVSGLASVDNSLIRSSFPSLLVEAMVPTRVRTDRPLANA